jgi:phosphopantothenoylcysteine decarboxylase/phosphopantothenate--cysteine ligase
MGAALASAALALGHDVHIISGPVAIEYPPEAQTTFVLTTDEMLDATRQAFRESDGLIGAAAPCDYQPRRMQSEKMTKTGRPVTLELVETADIVATLASEKSELQWVVGFALETNDHRFRATVKMQRKACDMMVSNSSSAIDSESNSVEILGPGGELLQAISASKFEVAGAILTQIDDHLIRSA